MQVFLSPKNMGDNPKQSKHEEKTWVHMLDNILHVPITGGNCQMPGSRTWVEPKGPTGGEVVVLLSQLR